MPIPAEERSKIEALAVAMVAASGLSYREVADAIEKETGHKVSHVWVARACDKAKKLGPPPAPARINKPGRHPANLQPKPPDDGVVATEIIRNDEDEARRQAFLDNCVGLGMDTIDMLRALARMLTRAAENNKNPQLLEGLTEVVADRTVRILTVVMPLVNREAQDDEAAVD